MYLSGLPEKEHLFTYYVTHFKKNVFSKAPNSKIYINYFQQGFHYLDDFSSLSRTIINVGKKADSMFADRESTGFVDLISKNERLIITDHKSRTLEPRSKRLKPMKRDVELDEYLRQLYVHPAAIKGKYGHYLDILESNYFCSQVMIQEPLELKRLYTVESRVSKTIDSITTSDKWNARPDHWRCSYLCDVYDRCEYKGLI